LGIVLGKIVEDILMLAILSAGSFVRGFIGDRARKEIIEDDVT
jgi:hypothetical protein